VNEQSESGVTKPLARGGAFGGGRYLVLRGDVAPREHQAQRNPERDCAARELPQERLTRA